MRFGSGRSLARLAAALGLGAALLLTGCGEFFTPVNNNPGGGSTSFVYVTNLGSGGTGGTLSAYSMTSGVLTELTGSPYALTATPTSIVVAPNNAFLYVGTNLGIFLYTIGSDGTLTEGNNNTIVYEGATQTQSMAVDSTSSWLIIANQNSSELDALPIDSTTGVPPSVTPVSFALNAATPQQVVIAPANNNIFVAEGANGAEAIGFNASNAKPFGTAVNIALYAKGGADNAIASDPTSKYLYIAEATSKQLRSFTIADFSAKEADYAIGNGPTAILPDPSGAYVYVANNSDNTITGFTQSAGVLTAQADSPFATAKAPVGLVEDSSKTYVLAIGFGNNPNLWIYSYDGTTAGTLDVKSTTSTGSTDPSLSNAIAVTH